MKSINSINDALTYMIEGLYDAEKLEQKLMPEIIDSLNSEPKSVLREHHARAHERRTKLKRAFSYLLAGPFDHKNKIAKEMIFEIIMINQKIPAPEIKNALLAHCIRNYIQFRICSYESALLLSSQLELEKVSDLLSEIIAWERETASHLKILNSNLAVHTHT